VRSRVNSLGDCLLVNRKAVDIFYERSEIKYPNAAQNS